MIESSGNGKSHSGAAGVVQDHRVRAAAVCSPSDFSQALQREGVGPAGVSFARSLEMFAAGLAASQDDGTSGRETERSRDAGEPAAGTAPRSEVGTKAGENPGSDRGSRSSAQGARPGP